MSTDKEFMKIAIELSKKADQPYGSIVVRKDKIIGRSDADTNIKKSMFKHAQMIAIEDALKNNTLMGNLKGCILYSSCEPCMMCQEAILAEGISRVVYAATIEDSNRYFCDEFPVSIEDIMEKSNSHIKIISELHRAKAVDILKRS